MRHNTRVLLAVLAGAATLIVMTGVVVLLFGVDFSAEALALEAVPVVRSTGAPQEPVLAAMPETVEASIAPIVGLSHSGTQLLLGVLASIAAGAAVTLLMLTGFRPKPVPEPVA